MAVRFFNRNIPDECHQKMKDFSAASDDVTWVAFPPGGDNRWSIVTKNGAFFNRNIPDERHQKMQDLSKDGAKIVCVAFPPQGGNGCPLQAGKTNHSGLQSPNRRRYQAAWACSAISTVSFSGNTRLVPASVNAVQIHNEGRIYVLAPRNLAASASMRAFSSAL